MLDILTKKAAEIFNCEESAVTPAMRTAIKKARHGENYSAGGIQVGKILGQYPVRQELI